jgi:hypothetical protein
MNAIGSDNLISEEYFPTLNCAYYDTSRWVSRSKLIPAKLSYLA